MAKSHSQIWKIASATLSERLTEDVYSRWIAVIDSKSLTQNTLVLRVSCDFYQEWVEENYLGVIEQAVSNACGKTTRVRFEVDATMKKVDPPSQTKARKRSARTRSASKPRDAATSLNSKYIFDNFVIGPSNTFAHASSLAVAQAPGKAYNPLFIHGGSGLGKTHLMQAIGHYVLNKGSTHVCYLSCESLMNEYISALQQRSLVQFRAKYRTTDVLLIDDIHFLANKDSLQEEFFHTFNVLYDARKQIIMSSDRPAVEIAGLEQRLVSRFEWGLVTELGLPDFETRMAILRAMQDSHNVKLPEDVHVFIASNIKSSIRTLEGAFTTVTSYASFIGKRINVETVSALLRKHLETEQQSTVNIDTIQHHVASYFDLRLGDMTARRRSRAVAEPRQIAMFLCRRLTSCSLPEIGTAFAKTHATVLHACRSVENKLHSDERTRQAVTKLTHDLGRNPSDVFGDSVKIL